MIEKSDAFVALPGGLGTLDELFEVWTTATLAMHAKPMVLLDVDGFYRPLLDWLGTLGDRHFLKPAGLDLLLVAETVPAALTLLESRLT